MAKVPDSCGHLSQRRVQTALRKAQGNLYEAARKLNISVADLRRLTLAWPLVRAAALEAEHRALDDAEAAILNLLRFGTPKEKLKAASFIAHRSRWWRSR